MLEFLKQPWTWYASGAMIGLLVPLLLVIGNKPLGISSSFKHICAACFPAGIDYFNYNWKKDAWNLFFVGGILGGAFLAVQFLSNPNDVVVNPTLLQDLNAQGITDHRGLLPTEVFSWHGLATLRGFVLIVIGGFLVGFGTRYAEGCTSGHAIMGLSNLQFSSLIATMCFMAGGFIMSNLIMPYLLAL